MLPFPIRSRVLLRILFGMAAHTCHIGYCSSNSSCRRSIYCDHVQFVQKRRGCLCRSWKVSSRGRRRASPAMSAAVYELTNVCTLIRLSHKFVLCTRSLGKTRPLKCIPSHSKKHSNLQRGLELLKGLALAPHMAFCSVPGLCCFGMPVTLFDMGSRMEGKHSLPLSMSSIVDCEYRKQNLFPVVVCVVCSEKSRVSCRVVHLVRLPRTLLPLLKAAQLLQTS